MGILIGNVDCDPWGSFATNYYPFSYEQNSRIDRAFKPWYDN